MRIVCFGEILWDVAGGVEYLGGAPLNFASCMTRLGNEAVLLSAVGRDDRGEKALHWMKESGLDIELVETKSLHRTGVAVVSTDQSGNTNFVIERPAAFDFINLGGPTLSRLVEFSPQWIYFGTLAQTATSTEAALKRLVMELPGTRRFYDVNLRDGHWNRDLVRRLSRLAHIIKLNDLEAETLFGFDHPLERFSLEAFCSEWSRSCGCTTICVTRGEAGCSIWHDKALHTFPGFRVEVVDTVGAGDAFSAGFLHGLGLGWRLDKAARFANGLGAIVASRPGAIPLWTMDECLRLIESQTPDYCADSYD